MKNNLKNVNTKKKKQYIKIQKFNRKIIYNNSKI